jgi:hypothetical protein
MKQTAGRRKLIVAGAGTDQANAGMTGRGW